MSKWRHKGRGRGGGGACTKTSFASNDNNKKKAEPRYRGSVRKIPTRTTFMMFVLTAVFVVNYLPYLTLVSLRVAMRLERLVEMLGLNVYHLGVRSYFINCAVNPLVYGLCSARFQREFRRLFRCKTY